jgi:hypothetical protein
MRLVLACFFLTIAISMPAFSQCATGVSTGGGNCVPPDANTPSIPRAPAAVWADQWGAIALDQASGQAGTVTGYDTKREAVTSAMNDCAKNGAANCKVQLVFYNQCAAVAFGDGVAHMFGNPTQDGAEREAMSACKASGSACKIVYTGCSLAKRVR